MLSHFRLTIFKKSRLTVFKNFFNLFLVVLGLHCCTGFLLLAVSGSYSVVVVRVLLIAVASLVEHRL